MKFNWTNALIMWAISTLICTLLSVVGVPYWPALIIDIVLLCFIAPYYPVAVSNKE